MKICYRFAVLLLPSLFLFASTLFGQQSYVLLVSFDGFRHDYVGKYDLPNFKALIEKGTAAEALIPCFPSKTFPNHYTIVTGLYPGHHGLVDNNFYDKPREVTFTMSNRDLVRDPYFYGGLPLWQLVQRNGFKSASYFWVGSEGPVAGETPTYFRVYDGSVPNIARIDTVMQWFSLPLDNRPIFVTLYFSLVDSEGHRTGPESEDLARTVREADRLLGQIRAGVEQSGLPINVIVTSDHGMYELDDSPGTLMIMEEVLASVEDRVKVVGGGTHINLFLKPGEKKKAIVRKLSRSELPYTVYPKDKFPPEWHYENEDRVGDILLLAEPGHFFIRKETARWSEKRDPPTWGVHGYDPYQTPEMNGIFYAEGPDIAQGVKIEPLESIHIYPFIAYLLGVEAPEVDGRLSVLRRIIR
jgi:predicted AlkP superfamily pyrophosphatase or phosphodiesterase